MDLNKTLTETIPHQFMGEYQETRKFNLEYSGIGEGSMRKQIILNKEGDVDANYGFNNLHISGDLKKIEKILLGYNTESKQLGYDRQDVLIDCIYPSLTKQERFSIMQTNILPAIKSHEWWIQITYSDDIQISIDVNKIINPLKENESVDIVFRAHRYQGNEYVAVGKNCCKLAFNWLCTKLIIVSMAWLDNIELNIFNSCECVDPILIKQTGIISECKFDKPINMSNYSNINLKYVSNDISVINVFVEYINILNINKDKIILQFSS